MLRSGGGAFVRRAHLVAINNAWTNGDHLLIEGRYGFNQLLDDNRPTPFDPRQLGFDPAFLSIAPQPKFPSIAIADYSTGNGFLATGFNRRRRTTRTTPTSRCPPCAGARR